MKSLLAVLFVFLSTILTSCEVIGGIFKAGVWIGVLAVVAVVGLVIFLFTRGKK